MAWGPRAMGRSFEQTKRGCGMYCSIRPAINRGRQYAFPVVWAAVFATGVGLSEPLPSFDAAPYLSFAPIGNGPGLLARRDDAGRHGCRAAGADLPAAAGQRAGRHPSLDDRSVDGPWPLRRARQRAAPPGPAPCRQPAHRRRARRLLPRRLLHAAHRHPPGRGRAAHQGRPRAGRPRQQGRLRAQAALHHRHPARGARGQSARDGRPRAAPARCATSSPPIR